MKKIALLTLTALIMVGCAEKNSDGSIKLLKEYSRTSNNPSVSVIDSCEYINWDYGLAHKGNCRYCTERRKQELKELVKQLKAL